MNVERASLIRTWLAAKGELWRTAVDEASRFLLRDYMKQFGYIVPVELHRLAATLRAKVVRLKDLKGEAILMPAHAGFRIIIRAEMLTGRYRTSIAHELVHTLFYINGNDSIPRRAVPNSSREEHFCFEVARHLLAPKEHLEIIGIFSENDPAVVLNKLTRLLLLSRPLAARVMLADYALAKGIAGRWVRTANGWMQEYGSSSATSCLTELEKRKLRKAADDYLKYPDGKIRNQRVVAVPERSGDGIFMLVTTV